MPRGCPGAVLITAGFRATIAEVYGAPTSTPRTANSFRSCNCLSRPVLCTMPRWPNSGHTSCTFFAAGTPATTRLPSVSQNDGVHRRYLPAVISESWTVAGRPQVSLRVSAWSLRSLSTTKSKFVLFCNYFSLSNFEFNNSLVDINRSDWRLVYLFLLLYKSLFSWSGYLQRSEKFTFKIFLARSFWHFKRFDIFFYRKLEIIIFWFLQQWFL